VRPEDRARVLAPPTQTAALPGIGGVIRTHPEDFEVEEIPAYEPDGRPGAHLLVQLEKRGWNTEAALREVARQVCAPVRELGRAGLKDRHAVTRQWISIPAQFGAAIAGFSHPDLHLGTPYPHSNKIRRGHLRGNRFRVVIRELEAPLGEAQARAEAKIAQLVSGGLLNLFGSQRFGHGGQNLDRGLSILRAGKRRRRPDFQLSAGQSAIFNLYAIMRDERGNLGSVIEGDVLKKTDTGGLFRCEDPEEDQRRLDLGEIGVTGPLPGSRMFGPTEASEAEILEHAVLEAAGVATAAVRALGRGVPGDRRRLWVRPQEVSIVPHLDEAALELRFILPAGSYATVLLRELGAGDPRAV
jgi:tRNA pseudouridine13 synthase